MSLLQTYFCGGERKTVGLEGLSNKTSSPIFLGNGFLFLVLPVWSFQGSIKEYGKRKTEERVRMMKYGQIQACIFCICFRIKEGDEYAGIEWYYKFFIIRYL